MIKSIEENHDVVDTENNKEYEMQHELQALYDDAIDNQTDLYQIQIRYIEDQLYDRFGDGYRDIISLIDFSLEEFDKGEFYSKEDILKIKVGNILHRLRQLSLIDKDPYAYGKK